jgi:hypothetical protein
MDIAIALSTEIPSSLQRQKTANEPFFPSCLIRALAFSKTGYGRVIYACQNDREERLLVQDMIDLSLDHLHRNQSMETCCQIEDFGHRLDPTWVYGSGEVHE